jgi:hypothetical protein
MEGYSHPYRATSTIPVGLQVAKQEATDLLGGKSVFFGEPEKMSRMGISGWASLLVYKRDYLSGREETKLEREDEDMPGVRGVSINVPYR